MNSQFETLCEKFGVIKTVKKIMYPRQVKFSPEFVNALREEYFRQKLEEDVDHPIRDRGIKFLKALSFHLHEFETNPTIELEEMKRLSNKGIKKGVKHIETIRKKLVGAIQPDKPTKQEDIRRKQIPIENIKVKP